MLTATTPQDCDSAIQKAHPTSDGEMEGGAEGEAQGLTIRGIARELGIHRETVRKYMHAESPPMSRARATSEVS